MSTKKKIIAIIIGVEAIIIAAVIAFLFYINSDTVKVNRQLELAQRYLLEEDYEQAIAAFEVVIEIDPKNAEAYLGLAEAYEATDDIENMVKILERGSKRTDSDEISELLKEHKEEIEKKELAAQRAAEAAQEAANASQTNANPPANAVEVPAAQPEEATPVTTGFVVMQDGEICYYDEQGNLVTGWFEVGNNRYCARIDGRLYKDGRYEIESVKYEFASNGICLREAEDDAWKQAYIDYIRQEHRESCAQYGNGHDLYGLIYVDNNDIPELTVCPIVDVQYTTTFIVSYANGMVYGDPGCWAYGYIERGNLFYVQKDLNDISATVQILSIKDGKQFVIAEGYYNDDEWYFEWNGMQVTYEEYEKELNKVYDEDKSVWAETPYTYEEILDVISNY